LFSDPQGNPLRIETGLGREWTPFSRLHMKTRTAQRREFDVTTGLKGMRAETPELFMREHKEPAGARIRCPADFAKKQVQKEPVTTSRHAKTFERGTSTSATRIRNNHQFEYSDV